MAASDLATMLERHYLPEGRLPAGLFVNEIQSPDGRRRADALWCPWSTVGGISGLVGHEIKVSRADLVVELRDPLKFEPWAKYCDHARGAGVTRISVTPWVLTWLPRRLRG